MSGVELAAVFAPLVFDTAHTLIRRRARAEKNMFAAHREHLYRRIAPEPAEHRQVSNAYFGLSVVSGLEELLASGSTPLRFFGQWGLGDGMLPVRGLPAPHRRTEGLPLGTRDGYVLEYGP